MVLPRMNSKAAPNPEVHNGCQEKVLQENSVNLKIDP